jgi:hypothetical protein
MTDITSANSVLFLAAPLAGLVVPQQMQGWAADDLYDVEPMAVNETLRGADGLLSAGFVFGDPKFTLNFQADSPSVAFFDALVAFMTANVMAVPVYGTLTLPSVGQSWALLKGFIPTYMWAPSGKRVLQPRKFPMTWESIVVGPVGING